MTIDELKAIAKEIWEEMLNKGNFDRLYDLFDKDYVYHGFGGHEVRGPDDFKQFVIKIRENMPDLHFAIEDLIAESDKVVSWYTMRGTPKAVGKQVTLEGALLSRIADGKAVEDREITDRLSMAQQGAKGWFQKRMINGIVKQLDKGMGLAE